MDLKSNLDILRPLIHVVTEEEDCLIQDIYEQTKNNSQIFVYRTTTGIVPYNEYAKEADKKEDIIDSKTMPIHAALTAIQQNQSTDKRLIYILLDIDHHLYETQPANFQNIRKLKDMVLNIYHDYTHLKSLIIVSSTLSIPTKLQRYFEVVFYDLPDDEAITKKVQYLLGEFNSVSPGNQRLSTEIDETVKMGFRGLTLFEVEQIVMASLKKKKKLDIEEINAYKKTILRKTDLLDVLETNVTFDEIGGLGRIKHWFEKRKGVWSEEAVRLKIPPAKGVLMLGVTGCGKSLLAKAIGNYWGLPLIAFTPSKIFSSRVGESEMRLMKALKIIESVAPCAVLIDEIEKQFAGSQSSTFSDAGTTARVIGSFLTWYQDCTAPIFIVATCNSIQYLPPELISRFDDKFFVPLPSASDRASIFDIHLRKTGRDPKKLNIDVQHLGLNSPLLTGREIDQVVKASLVEMWHERNTTHKDVPLRQDHILKALQSKISVQKTMQEDLDYLVQWVGWDDEKKDGIRANYASDREDDIDALFNEILSKPSVLKKR
ncbi:MAG: AAA family ATPase [Candidatus Nanoarchaeia archaeon]|jgi:ATP-dependent 26S proteasome regulatory subunit|nr:AAA family ATPase [Candidatus Nanoarchaeia archaeon]